MIAHEGGTGGTNAGRWSEGAHPAVGVRVLVIGDDSHGIARALADDMRRAFPNLGIDGLNGPEDLLAWENSLAPSDCVPLGLVTSEVNDIDALLERMDSFDTLVDTQWLVVTDQSTHSDLSRATTSRRLSAVIAVPWTVPLLLGQSYSAMVRHFLADGGSREDVHSIIGAPPSIAVQGPLLEGLDLEEHEVVRELLEGVERVLGPRPRLIIPAKTTLAIQGQSVDAVHLVLDGEVSLHRDSMHGEILAHHSTSGPLIGLVSLARGENAFFSATTTTTARVVRLTNEQIQIALAKEPSLAAPLAALAIQSLTRRLMRAEDLHVENVLLAADLEVQRKELEEILEDLRATRAQLVDHARFAMLGELSAGIAHELNNPVTALARSAEHLHEDIERLLGVSGELTPAKAAMLSAFEAAPRSTADERMSVRELLDVLGGDRRLARRLVRAGVSDPVRAKALVSAGERALDLVESGARIGGALRAVLAASERVIDLTHSLKGYSRPDAQELQAVDVRAGINDVVRLTAHRLHRIVVTCDYADVPPVLAHPAKLEQVWTNLLVNAAEAIEDEVADCQTRTESGESAPPARGEDPAAIDVIVREQGNQVVVEICDNGPGIPSDLIERIFEPHFTTKAGRVRFGLGMGMSIVHSIVTDHGGDLSIASEPGRTCVTVALPRFDTSALTLRRNDGPGDSFA